MACCVDVAADSVDGAGVENSSGAVWDWTVMDTAGATAALAQARDSANANTNADVNRSNTGGSNAYSEALEDSNKTPPRSGTV